MTPKEATEVNHEEFAEREERRLKEDAEEELVLLRRAIDEGASRGWKLLSAIKQPGDDVLVLTWDTLVSFQG